jgi:hypothetical protein
MFGTSLTAVSRGVAQANLNGASLDPVNGLAFHWFHLRSHEFVMGWVCGRGGLFRLMKGLLHRFEDAYVGTRGHLDCHAEEVALDGKGKRFRPALTTLFAPRVFDTSSKMHIQGRYESREIQSSLSFFLKHLTGELLGPSNKGNSLDSWCLGQTFHMIERIVGV